jgi:hypothetical protein
MRNQTLGLLREPGHLGDKALHLVINTHCHSDHMGDNALLARTYGCPLAVPEREASLIREWDTRALWLDYADQHPERIAALDVTTVIQGQGQPFAGISAALDRSYQRVEAFTADPKRMARHALKVMLMFTLLERRQLPLSTLPEYLDNIRVYRNTTEPIFGLRPRLWRKRS